MIKFIYLFVLVTFIILTVGCDRDMLVVPITNNIDSLLQWNETLVYAHSCGEATCDTYIERPMK